MAYSRINYVGNGSQTQFAINFPLGFFTRSDVTCYVIGEVDGLGNQVYRTLTWINDGLVQVSGTAPSVGATVVFERTIYKDTLVHDYSDGSSIIEENLDQSNKQSIMLVHEVLDGRFGVLQNDIDMGQFKVKNLADPVDDNDAVNLRYFGANNALANRQAAEAAQAAAELAEANAEAAATTAAADVSALLAGYVVSAQTAKTAAETASTGSQTAEAGSVAAKVDAEAARDTVVAAVGGVKITNADTTTDKLNNKVAVSGLLTKTVTSPGGNESITFDVPSASQDEAEGGTDNTKAMTALRVKQAITANVAANVTAVHRGCLVRATLAQSVPNTKATAFTFDAEVYDTDAIHSTATNTTRLTVPAGVTKVKLRSQVTWAANPYGARQAYIYKNGAQEYYGSAANHVVPLSGPLTVIQVTSPVLQVVAGDYFELVGYQSSGGALSTYASGGSDSWMWFELEVVG